MDTLSKTLIIAVLVAILPLAAYHGHYNVAVLLAGGIGYVLWSHLREGTVAPAVRAFQKKDYERAKTLLAEIKKPDRLRKGRRNYYEFVMGNIALREERLDEAEYHFQLASRLPWRKDAEKGFVLINLANISLRKKNHDRVPKYLELASKLKLTQRQQAIVGKIEAELRKNTV